MTKIVSEKRVYTSERLWVDQLSMAFSDDYKEIWQRYNLPHGVFIVPIDTDGNIHLLKEYAIAEGAPVLTCAKGAIDAGETACDAAHRELKEELALTAEQYTELATLYLDPHYTDTTITVILAEGLSEIDKCGGDEHHDMIPAKMSLDDAMDAIINGQIRSSLAISALYHAKRALSE
jgi:ADP-ribose pyrophosphatase YjhB (NUDIX family)